jgi:hypothetical protein
VGATHEVEDVVVKGIPRRLLVDIADSHTGAGSSVIHHIDHIGYQIAEPGASACPSIKNSQRSSPLHRLKATTDRLTHKVTLGYEERGHVVPSISFGGPDLERLVTAVTANLATSST